MRGCFAPFLYINTSVGYVYLVIGKAKFTSIVPCKEEEKPPIGGLIINCQFSICTMHPHFAPLAVELQAVAVSAVFDEEVATQGWFFA